ncbi:cation:proton antiporter [Aeromicrobium sp.]|uniref:cation:proton antiporter n=1 Tax=Aeromicrobium sp. TaxID=1871063 RepID=UPI003C648F00
MLLAFGLALLLAVLTSALASRSPLSSTAVFLAVGIVAGPLVLDEISVTARTAEIAAEVALFAILFTDGQHAPWSVLRRHWKNPARTLVLGMPLTLVLVAALGHWVAGLSWPAALVLGAVLSPTDPVFASALVGRDDVPARVRHLLNIESGLNDGLALPAVLVLVGVAGGSPEGWSTEPLTLILELLLGLFIGVVTPLVVEGVLQIPAVESVSSLRPLGPIAIAVLLYGVCDVLHANQFLAAFAAGATIATLRPEVSESFRHTGELVSELAKGGALLAFAALLQVGLFREAGWSALVVAILVVAVTRPLPIIAVLAGTSMERREKLAVAWFGPKGFASVAYAVIVLSSGITDADHVFTVVAVTVLVSVLAHSSTDVIIAKWLNGDSPPTSHTPTSDSP